MLTKAEHRHDSSATAQADLPGANADPSRFFPLARLMREGAPYFYLTGAFVAFFATLYISAWFWLVPHSLLLSGACLHLAFVVVRRYSRTGNSGRG